MRFACIHDCSRCPFYRIEHPEHTASIPQPLQIPIEEEPKIKEDLAEAVELENAPEALEVNLPAVTDGVQYEVKDAEKKRGLTLWRKK